MATYTVKGGDSLSKIAASLGLSWRDIYELNKSVIGGDPNLIRPGQVLNLPGGSTATPAPTPTPAPPSTPFPTQPAPGGGTSVWTGETGWRAPRSTPLNGIPEGDTAEIWQDETGQYYVAYFIPGTATSTTGRGVPLVYRASASEVQAMFGPGRPIIVDFKSTKAQLSANGVLFVGDVKELANLTEHPFLAWASMMERELEVRPWLHDAEVLALVAEALLEGREVSEAEFQSTDWWQSHNEAQRQWLLLSESDPMEAARLTSQNRLLITNALRDAGVSNAPSALIDALANQFTQGNWDGTYLQNQIKALSDPYSGFTVDPIIVTAIGSAQIDTTREGELDVRELVQRWLGPSFGNWSQTQIEQWAGKLRNNPDAETELVNMLRAQRNSLLPGYTPEATYEDIAAPWRNFATSVWGQEVNETDPVFMQILKLNDAAEAGKLLRAEGLKRNVGQVVNQLSSALGQASGGQVRRAI